MVEKIKVLLVGVNINNDYNFSESMDELRDLAIACDYQVVGQVVQNLNSFNRAFCIGVGKIEKIKLLIEETESDVIIFDNELSPIQLRNLSRVLESEIMDRTALILEIFARRAKTKEAKIQVEVANLQYMLPRLIGLKESLSQQSGGVGTTTRGPGEKALELDRRRIEKKMFSLNKQLELIGNERQTQRKKRQKAGLPSVALVGYTNSGKSTLMNAIIDLFNKSENKKVLAKNVLFASLDTTARNITLSDNRSFLLFDTVGFVSKLPHNLVKAFRSTLEEVSTADLLLHVVDASSQNYEQQISTTEKTLQQIGAEGIPSIYVYNKAELTTINIPMISNNKIYISAKQKIGIAELIELISGKIFSHYIECNMFIPYEKGNLISYLNDNAYIKSVIHKNKGTFLSLECRESDHKRLKQFVC
jgi:GTP-binding protein HflX